MAPDANFADTVCDIGRADVADRVCRIGPALQVRITGSATLQDEQRTALRARLEVVRDRCIHKLGYGVGDNMNDLLVEHSGDG